MKNLMLPYKGYGVYRFLDEYKRQGGEVHIGSGGEILHTYNPDLIDDTLETALKKTGKEELYDKATNRVYNAKVFLEWHNNYVRHSNKKDLHEIM